MRAPQIVRDFLEWRWAPCVALTVGSLAYVGLAVLIIPSQIDAGSSASESSTPFNTLPAQPNTAFASSLTQNSLAGNSTPREPMRRSPPPANEAVAQRRGFSPPIDQPEVPPPPPPPPALAPGPPAPTMQAVPTANIPPPLPPAEAPVQQAPPAPAPAPAPGDESQ